MVSHRKEEDDRNRLGKKPVADIIEKRSVTIYDQDPRKPTAGIFGIGQQQKRDPKRHAQIHQRAGIFGYVQKGDDTQHRVFLNEPRGRVAINVESAENCKNRQQRKCSDSQGPLTFGSILCIQRSESVSDQHDTCPGQQRVGNYQEVIMANRIYGIETAGGEQ